MEIAAGSVFPFYSKISSARELEVRSLHRPTLWGLGTVIWNVFENMSGYCLTNTNILVYNRCKRMKHLLSSQMPPVHCIWMSLFLKHYKDMADSLQVCQEIILQRQVFAIVSSLWRAVPFSFWRSTCPLGPWWDCRAPRWRGQSQGCVDALWKRLLFWADPIFPMEPNGRPVRDSWGC